MKKLYVVHILAMLILFSLGIYFLMVQNNLYHELQDLDIKDRLSLEPEIDYKSPSRDYGICSLFFFAFSIIVGILTINRLRKTGIVLFLGGIAFFAWSCLMISTPGHISINEVFPAWVAYIIVSIIASVIGFLKIDNAPILKEHFENQILDDLD